MKIFGIFLLLLAGAVQVRADEPFRDRWVWVFGWNLERSGDVDQVSRVLATAGAHGLNGAVVSFGLDTLCQKSSEFFDRFEQVRQASERHGLELIPSVFSIGYAGAVLGHDRNLAEGLPVADAPFLVRGGQARFLAPRRKLWQTAASRTSPATLLLATSFMTSRGRSASPTPVWPTAARRRSAWRTSRPTATATAG